MATTAVTVHRKNGFFIFEDGYKYVLVLTAGLVSLSILGAGRFSLDHAQGTGFNGLYAGLGAAALGCLGSARFADRLLATIPGFFMNPYRSDGACSM